jgi:hypothetical protein
MHHFGIGLVATAGDFGALGEKPTHPELLDWLADRFASVPGGGPPDEEGIGWRMKRLHRLIMTSTAYRQSSLREPAREAIDPGNRFYWRKHVQRLDAEVIRDSMLAASGVLNSRMFGPPVPVREDLVGQVVVGIDKKQGDNKMPVDVPMGGEEFRRSVYIQVRRSRPVGFLNVFDAPAMELNCERRQYSTVPTQALMLMNSDFILQQAARFADRLRREAGPELQPQIEHGFRLGFSRPPRANELRAAMEFVSEQIRELKLGKSTGTVPAEHQAMTDFCQALLSANEFLYVD